MSASAGLGGQRRGPSDRQVEYKTTLAVIYNALGDHAAMRREIEAVFKPIDRVWAGRNELAPGDWPAHWASALYLGGSTRREDWARALYVRALARGRNGELERARAYLVAACEFAGDPRYAEALVRINARLSGGP